MGCPGETGVFRLIQLAGGSLMHGNIFFVFVNQIEMKAKMERGQIALLPANSFISGFDF